MPLKESCVISIFALLAASAPCQAAPHPRNEDTLLEIQKIVPLMSIDELRSSFKKESESTGVPEDTLANQRLTDLRKLQKQTEDWPDGSDTKESNAPSDPPRDDLDPGGGFDTDEEEQISGNFQQKLPKASIGDIYVSPSYAGHPVLRYGHTGMYYRQDGLIEAPGDPHKVKKIYYADKYILSGTTIGNIGVRRPQQKTMAARFALQQRGKPYNSNLLWNKNVEDSSYNCSQLMYAAYKHAADIDFAEGQVMVWPIHIRKSRWYLNYRYIKF